jgi:hypothetical protein
MTPERHRASQKASFVKKNTTCTFFRSPVVSLSCRMSRLNFSIDKVLNYPMSEEDEFNPFDAYEFVSHALDQVNMNDELRKAFILQPKDTVKAFKGKQSFMVIEPQLYNRVTTLYKNHEMFDDDEREDGCRGLFSQDEHGNAVSGSGDDIWYKHCAEFEDFCLNIVLQVTALTDDRSDDECDALQQSISDTRDKMEDLHTKKSALQKKLSAFDKRPKKGLDKLDAIWKELDTLREFGMKQVQKLATYKMNMPRRKRKR